MPFRSLFFPLIAISLIMVAPLGGLIAFAWPDSSDLIFYALILKHFSSQFWEGDFYPRWLMEMNDGFGSPVFLFYSPLAFYISNLFEWLAPLDTHGFARVVCSMGLALFVAGITCYRWLRLTLPRPEARQGALLYAAFPYLLFIIYFGFGIAQLWAIALFPLLLEAAHRLAKKGWRCLPVFSLAYSLLFLVHLPSSVVFGAVPCAYAIAQSPAGQRIRMTLLSGGGALLGLALSAIYWLPAVMNKPYIASHYFMTEKFSYTANFLDMQSLIAMGLVIVPLMGFFSEMSKPDRARCLTPSVKFWMAVMAALLVMALPLSMPLWDIFLPLQYLQFPFRFFIAMLPAAVFIAISWRPYVKHQKQYAWFLMAGLPAVTAASLAVAFSSSPSMVESVYATDTPPQMEYRTLWMEAASMEELPKAREEDAWVASGRGRLTLMEWQPRLIRLQADIRSPEARVDFGRFYFPGWIASAGVVSPSDRALLALELPQGKHEVTLALPWFAGEREGKALSLAGLALWGLLALLSFRKSRVVGG